MESPLSILNKYWGFDSFRAMQRPIIENVLEGKDTLALLPTGGGKSICYQVPGIALGGVTVVISPLIALMHDQVDGLKKKGIAAIALTSELNYRQLDIILDNAVHGKYQFIFASPERLKTDIFTERLKRMDVKLLAIDEAHCISQWGYDFRPSYLEIASIRELLPDIPVLALTATATPEVADDIQERLNFEQPNIIKGDFARKNLSYFITETEKKDPLLLKALQKNSGSSVIYFKSRRKTREYSDWLNRQGISANYYHAGLNSEDRQRIQQDWIQGKTRVICATNAFGMGIDKPDVHTVFHLDLPDNLESYFQEAGRAGRDGEKSFAITLFHKSDFDELQRRFELSFPPISEIKRIYQAMGNYFQIAEGGGFETSHELDIQKFSRNFDLQPLVVFSALKILQREGLISYNESGFYTSRFMFLVDNRTLYDFKLRTPKMAPLIDTLLRSYEGYFDDYISIFESRISQKLKSTRYEVVAGLNYLKKLEIVDYTEQSESGIVTYTRERIPTSSFRLQPETYSDLKKRAQNRLKSMENFVNNKETCRSVMLLNYFGQNRTEECGICDYCIKKKKGSIAYANLNEYVKLHKTFTLEEAEQAYPNIGKDSLLENLRLLIDEQMIEEIDLNKFKLKEK